MVVRGQRSWAIIASALWVMLACSSPAQDWDPTVKRDPDEGGDKKRLPIVFVHGMNGSGDNFERQSMYFISNGYPATWINAYDYNTGGANPGVEGIDKFIDSVLSQTGHAKVNLVGHSRGTGESSRYLADATRAPKVAHYASIGGRPVDNPNGVPSIAIGSKGDVIAGPPRASNGGVTAELADQDHVKVAASKESFAALFTFFNDGEKPKLMEYKPQEEIQVSGYVKTYIQNQPLPGAKVDVWEVAKETGRRNKDKPLVTLVAADDGQVGPFRAKPRQYYEFVVKHPMLKRDRHVYREPWVCSDRLMYFRVASTDSGATPAPTDKHPEVLTDKVTAFNVRHNNGALTPGKASLKINGTEVCTEKITPKARTVVGLYAVDGNANGQSEFAPVDGRDWSASFVGSVDLFIPADPNASVKFDLNGRVLNVPAWPASETGHINVLFETD